jgi:hypothetical protein
MRRKTIHAIVVFTLLLVLVAQPAQAFENPLAGFGTSIKARLNRFYLMLPGEKSGESVLTQSALAMEGLKSLSFSAGVDADVLDVTDQSLVAGSFKVGGPAEIKDVYDPKSTRQDINFAGELTMQGTTLKANTDMKIDGETMYLKINEVPLLPFFDLAPLKGMWLKLDNSQSMTADETADSSETESEMTAEEREAHKAAFMDLLKASQISTAKKEKYQDFNVFTVETTVPDDAILAYVEKTGAIEKETEAEIQKSKQETAETLASIDDIKIKTMIDRSSFYLRHIEAPIVIDAQKFQAGESESSATTPLGDFSDAKTIKLNFVVDMTDFNKPVTFEVPTDAQDFQAAFAGAMNKQSGMPMMMPEPTLSEPSSKMMVKPSELPELSAEEKALLKQYGIDASDL